MARPGIMLYFDILEPIKVLSDADKGRLLEVMLEYGKDGMVPEFEGMLALAWAFVQPKLDRDDEAYENAKLQRRYAADCKRRTSLDLPKLSYEEWRNIEGNEMERMVKNNDESLRAVDSVGSRCPNTAATAAQTINTKTAISAAAAVTKTVNEDIATATEDKKLKSFRGELGQGVVFLSEEQIEDLLDKLDLDAFDYYVKKLADFILKNGAKPKNHYETILKWWRQDSGVQRT